MNTWFTTDAVDSGTYILSEYRHWEETHCYLLNGSQRSLLIDTGLGICDIHREVARLTDRPVTAVATHVHWDHIGGHQYYPDFYAHAAELPWLQGRFPQPLEAVRRNVVCRCRLPEGFDVGAYRLFQGTPTRVLQGGETIDLGGRTITVLHTPGHAPGHMCFWEEARGYLFTGDLVYKGTIDAYYPSTDPAACLSSLRLLAALPARKIFPGHHSLDISPEMIPSMVSALETLRADGKLRHGSGLFDYGDWAIHL